MDLTKDRTDVEDPASRRARTLSQPRPLWWRRDPAYGATPAAPVRLRGAEKDQGR